MSEFKWVENTALQFVKHQATFSTDLESVRRQLEKIKSWRGGNSIMKEFIEGTKGKSFSRFMARKQRTGPLHTMRKALIHFLLGNTQHSLGMCRVAEKICFTYALREKLTKALRNRFGNQNTQASPEFLTLPQVIPTSIPIPIPI